jgi:type II secretory pathway pseudopilin PulG
MKNQKGFAYVTELLVVLGIVVVLTPGILVWVKNSQKSQTASQLADTSKSFASAYNQYIKQNFANMYEQAVARPGQIIAIKYNDVKNSGEFASLNTYNFNLTPCVLYKFNPSGKQFQAIMLFTSNSQSKPIDKIVGSKSALTYGLGSGYYDNGQVRGSTWSLANSADFISSANQCGGAIAQYSPVINLSIGNDYPTISDTNSYLSRLSDDSTKGGDTENENTMQANVYMQSGQDKQAIFLEGSDQDDDYKKQFVIGSMQSKAVIDRYKAAINHSDEVQTNAVGTYVGGKLMAQSLSASQQVVAYTACDKTELSTIVRQEADPTLPLTGQLQCTHNPIQCPTGYCYMPISDLAIKFRPLTSNYRCKVGYIDQTVQPDVREDQQPPTFQCEERYCAHWSIVGTCDRHDWDHYPNQWANPSTKFSLSEPTSANNYTIYKTISATTTWQVQLPPNRHSGGSVSCNPPAGQQTTMPGKIYGVTCTTSNPVLEAN